MLIKLKYLAPTNHRGTRIKAICNQITKIYHWDYSLDTHSNYRQSSMQLVLDLRKLNPDVLPPVSSRIYFVKDEIFALVSNCEGN